MSELWKSPTDIIFFKSLLEYGQKIGSVSIIFAPFLMSPLALRKQKKFDTSRKSRMSIRLDIERFLSTKANPPTKLVGFLFS